MLESFFAQSANGYASRHETRHERDAQIEKYAFSHNENIERDISQEQFGIQGNEQHLADGIDRHQNNSQGIISQCKKSEDNDHGNTWCKTV